MIRFFFDSPAAAVSAMKVILLQARESKDNYEFGGLTVESWVDSGIWLIGETDKVAALLDAVPGALRQESVGR